MDEVTRSLKILTIYRKVGARKTVLHAAHAAATTPTAYSPLLDKVPAELRRHIFRIVLRSRTGMARRVLKSKSKKAPGGLLSYD